MKTILTPFWYDKPSILWDRGSITEIFPSRRFDIVRKLNAIVRLLFIYSLLIYAYKRNINVFAYPLVGMIITWIIHRKQIDIRKKTIIDKSVEGTLQDLTKINDLSTQCRVPNKENPFMNPKLTDYGNNKPPPPRACPSYNNVGIQRRVEELFNEDLYRDVTDIFGKKNSQRQYYTVPGSQVPNDQGSFAQWLYGRPPTCKEGNQIACLADLGNSGGSTGNST